jgi:putative DNA primase/helicase
MAKKGETHPTDQAGLFGRRLAVCMETPEGRSMDEARMKALTGGDLITARRMREDFWTFAPTHKLILATNHKPNIRTTDHGTWRRQKLVPFTVQIPERETRQNPSGETHQQRPLGLLRWAVEGCLAWQRRGLGEPEAVKTATAEWREESDPLAAFLTVECELGGDFQVEASRLFAAYERFAADNDDESMSKQAFGRRLTERGMASGKGTGGVRQWLGIKLRPEGSKSTSRVRAVSVRGRRRGGVEGAELQRRPLRVRALGPTPRAPGGGARPRARAVDSGRGGPACAVLSGPSPRAHALG